MGYLYVELGAEENEASTQLDIVCKGYKGPQVERWSHYRQLNLLDEFASPYEIPHMCDIVTDTSEGSDCLNTNRSSRTLPQSYGPQKIAI